MAPPPPSRDSLPLALRKTAHILPTPTTALLPTRRKPYLVDARETAPAAASENMYQNRPGASTKGGLAVAVPGEVAGLWVR